MYIVGEEGLEVHGNLVIVNTSVGQAEQCYQSAGAMLPCLNKGGHTWQMAVAGLLRSASCPVLIQGPLEEMQRSRTLSEYKLQTNITIQYSIFFSLLFLSSMDTPGWLMPQQTDPLDKYEKGGGKD